MRVQEKKTCRESKQVYRSSHDVIIYNLSTKNAVAVPVPENHYVSWLDFASDNRLLNTIRTHTTIGSGGSYSLGRSRIFSIGIDNFGNLVEDSTIALFEDEKRLLRQNRYLSRVTNFLRQDPDHIIMPAVRSGDLDLWKVNIISGEVERIALGRSGTFYWYADNMGNPILRFDCVGSKCRRINVYSPGEEGDEWKRIKTFKTKPDENQEDFDFWPIAPTGDPNQFYVFSDEEEDDRRSIKIFDVKNEVYTETVFEHPNVDVGGALTNIQTGEYAGAWYVEDTLNYALTDTYLQKHYNAIKKYFDSKANVSLLAFNKSGEKAVFYVYAPNMPGAYYIYDFKSTHIDKILSTEPSLESSVSSQTDILRVPMRDGSFITAYHSYPKNRKGDATLPLLVLPHGGPEVRDFYNFDYTEQYFVARGYQTIRMNFRGSSGFGKKFAEAGYGEWGGLMQNDVNDTVEYLFTSGLAQPGNSCIVGYSYGGYVALYSGAMTPDLYNCIVSGGGVSDLALALRNTRKDFGRDSEVYDYWKTSFGTEDKATLNSLSPVFFAENFSVPTLLVHGKYDDVVYEAQSKRMYKALKKAKKPAEYLELEEFHSNWDLESEILYHETVEAFLKEHLTGQFLQPE